MNELFGMFCFITIGTCIVYKILSAIVNYIELKEQVAILSARIAQLEQKNW